MIAAIFHRFGPYHVARLAAAGRRGDVLGIEVSAATGEYAWDLVPGAHGFRRITLAPDDRDLTGAAIAARTVAALAEHRPHTVFVNGWSGTVPLAALRWCLRNDVPAVVMSESAAIDERRSGWKEAIKRKVVGCFSAALVGGSRHREYAIQLGVRADRVFQGYDAVDNAHFARGADAARNDSSIRTQLGLPDRYFLASNRFVPKKNLSGLLRGYAAYRAGAGTEPWDLVLLGDGPLRSEVERTISELGLFGAVHLPGFKQYAELPVYYGLAGAFVHASTSEQWGLVVNEAMAAALPVLVSDRCGCAPDLVEPGVNGFRFDPANPAELARVMTRVATAPAGGREMGRAGRAAIDAFSPEVFADGFWNAAEAVRGTRSPHAGHATRLLLSLLTRR